MLVWWCARRQAGTTYVDSPTKMERFERGAQSSKLLKNVVGSGYSSADYQPRQGELKEVEPGPLWKPSNQTGNVLLPVELLERPVSTDVVVSKEVMSSGYGTKGDWQPPLGQKKRIDYYRPVSVMTKHRALIEHGKHPPGVQLAAPTHGEAVGVRGCGPARSAHAILPTVPCIAASCSPMWYG